MGYSYLLDFYVCNYIPKSGFKKNLHWKNREHEKNAFHTCYDVCTFADYNGDTVQEV